MNHRPHLKPHRRRIIWITVLSCAYVLFYFAIIFVLKEKAWEKVSAVNGVVDLSKIDFSNTGALTLAGRWEFYPDVLSQAGQRPSFTGKKAQIISVPGTWPEHQTTGQGFDSRFGFGTYRLSMRLTPGRHYSLQFGAITTAARILVNGQLLATLGKTGTDATTHRAATYPISVVFLAESEWNELAIEISNFDHHHGGLTEAPLLGDPVSFQKILTLRITYDIAMATILIILGINGIVAGFAWMNERASIYLGLFNLCLGIQTLMTGSRVASLLNIPWPVFIRIEYISYIVALPCFILFVRNSFPQESSPRIPYVITFVTGVYVIAIVFLHSSIFTRFVQPFMVIVILTGLYATIVCARAIRSGKRDALYISFGFLSVFAGICFDLLGIIQAQVQLLVAPATAALFAHLNSLVLTDHVAFSLFRSRQSTQKLYRMGRSFNNSKQMLKAARLVGLQERLNPHFLFNALNTVHSLITHDPSKARDAILQLADLYRGITNASNKLHVPFASEWDLISSYLEIQNARFKGQVKFDLALRGDLGQIPVPPLALQQLVENSFKHGLVGGKENRGIVRIRIAPFRDGLAMILRDNGRGLAGLPVGETLDSIRERSAAIYSTVRLRLRNRPSGGVQCLLLLADR
ncbi:MAG: histidine kinase [Spirochaetia bacterium]|nr:histidine kinase [Spirochaetia bacterium]